MEVKFKLSHGAKIPMRNTKFDSGMDLKAKGFKSKLFGDIWFDNHENDPLISECILCAHETMLIKTGVQIQLPEPIEYDVVENVPLDLLKGYYEVVEAQVRTRSGLALKSGIIVLNSPGTIDLSYTGDIGVILHNTTTKPFIIKNNDRIAQLVFNKVIIPFPDSIIVVSELDDTDRGNNGFGSSGV